MKYLSENNYSRQADPLSVPRSVFFTDVSRLKRFPCLDEEYDILLSLA